MKETSADSRPSGPDTQTLSTGSAQKAKSQSPSTATEARTPVLEAYWVERKRYLEHIRKVPELRRRNIRATLIYLLRRFLWSFGFFPIFIAFWVPLVLSWFNPVVMVTRAMPSLQAFINANPEVQANTEQTLFIAWLSIGFIFAVFDLVLTPFKSPYEYEADVHMRAWEQEQKRRRHESNQQRRDPLPDKV
ncbi:DUF2189 domain-containing protein [Mangrovitalea sediminis]|uniref:hypothetical protein n=1 Tax=Mangrovitalea sediminis TaxID=1982043 RepID=UPI001D0CFC2F|nr:hypothetical protein [Mangrovitalea sediminis]